VPGSDLWQSPCEGDEEIAVLAIFRESEILGKEIIRRDRRPQTATVKVAVDEVEAVLRLEMILSPSTASGVGIGQ